MRNKAFENKMKYLIKVIWLYAPEMLHLTNVA